MADKYDIRGAYGLLEVDEKGNVLEYTRDPYDTDEDEMDQEDSYIRVARVDVDEYAKWFGEMHDTDILLIGYWTKDGEYEEPEADARAEFLREYLIDHPDFVLPNGKGVTA